MTVKTLNSNGNDMNNGWDARVLQLDERVTNLRTTLSSVEQETRTGFAQVNTAISNLSNEVRTGQKTQWPTILMVMGLIVTVVISIGGAFAVVTLAPIREQVADNRITSKETTMQIAAILAGLPEAYIPRRESENLRLRAGEDRARTEASLVELRTKTVDRNEWMERNRARDIELNDIRGRIDELVRQVGDTYGARDVILDLKGRVDALQGFRGQTP